MAIIQVQEEHLKCENQVCEKEKMAVNLTKKCGNLNRSARFVTVLPFITRFFLFSFFVVWATNTIITNILCPYKDFCLRYLPQIIQIDREDLENLCQEMAENPGIFETDLDGTLRKIGGCCDSQ